MERPINTKDAANILKVSENYVTQLCRAQALNAMRPQSKGKRKWMIERSSVEAYLQKRRTPHAETNSHGHGAWEVLKKIAPIVRKFGFERFMSMSEAVMNSEESPEIRKLWISLGAISHPNTNQINNDTEEPAHKDLFSEFFELSQ